MDVTWRDRVERSVASEQREVGAPRPDQPGPNSASAAEVELDEPDDFFVVVTGRCTGAATEVLGCATVADEAGEAAWLEADDTADALGLAFGFFLRGRTSGSGTRAAALDGAPAWTAATPTILAVGAGLRSGSTAKVTPADTASSPSESRTGRVRGLRCGSSTGMEYVGGAKHRGADYSGPAGRIKRATRVGAFPAARAQVLRSMRRGAPPRTLAAAPRARRSREPGRRPPTLRAAAPRGRPDPPGRPS